MGVVGGFIAPLFHPLGWGVGEYADELRRKQVRHLLYRKAANHIRRERKYKCFASPGEKRIFSFNLNA